MKSKGAPDLLQEMLECEKDLKIYRDMQKVYAFDYIDFVRWTEELARRRTLIGQVTYNIGKVVAITYIFKLFFSAKNILYPQVYRSDRISSNIHRALSFFKIYKEEDELFW